jgi:hypothetical protein
MEDPAAIERIVGQSLAQAVGNNESELPVESSGSVFSWLVPTGDLVPPWWSKARDKFLSEVWKTNEHLSIAVYNTQAKIVGIPPKIVARDTLNPIHRREAVELQYQLITTSGFGRAWNVEYGKFIEDIITQDNGGMMEVIGDGDPAGPILGTPTSIRHLDSFRCARTGNPVYPIVYTDDKGKRWKMHWTRVVYMSQLPSPRREMYGVGVCAVSRCINISQTLTDMIRYKLERLGSRPQNQMIVGKGITGEQIMAAMRMVEEEVSNQGLSRYARTVAIGSENTDVGIEKIDLNHLDPFNEEVSTNLGMFAIAAAFGMDADELWPASGRSSSQGDANLRRMRSRGRLPAQVTAEVAAQFNYKVLPPYLEMRFDFSDDAEDMQRANIKDIRGRNRERDLGTGAITIRASRIRMLSDGDLTQEMFDQMELADGRLSDGTPVSMLFYKPEYVDLLDVGSNPLAISDHEPDEMITKIQRTRESVLKVWAVTDSLVMRQAFHALDWLEQQYSFAAGRLLPEVPMQQRRMRTDIRVAPVEESPPTGEQSPAQAAAQEDENLVAVGGV